MYMYCCLLFYEGLANLFQSGSDLLLRQPSSSSSSSSAAATAAAGFQASMSLLNSSSTAGSGGGTTTASATPKPGCETDSMRHAIVESLQAYVGELARDIQTRMGGGAEWNGAMGESACTSALASAFVTYARRLQLPLKQIGKLDVDKIPTFVSKKAKGAAKKVATQSSVRGHGFVDCAFLSVRAVCVRCGQPFWGIGYQGMICQSIKHFFPYFNT